MLNGVFYMPSLIASEDVTQDIYYHIQDIASRPERRSYGINTVSVKQVP